ncbi:hypothetical protein F5J12DRAFT_895072 [Pisolithus orientalis]|uniref:uncharacterized protein n=1 Tax=Pisolithus orientalis TaxID=936130 RepID=UPI00222431E6|nr:uncharacterized protein F5J12DRAFT_895072 [Pisolithus orientalis]KAI5999829.1 hypothetical protein F5J12DRAFT_895072 [Pisolithus orientalis]
MPRKEWTTPKQKKFLQDELVQYLSMSTKEYSQYWPTVFKQWSQLWPERAVAFLDLPLDISLTLEQDKILGDAVTKHQQWLHWHMGAGKNRAANRKTLTIINSLMKAKTCIKKLLEIYSKMYYTSQVKPNISTDSNISSLHNQINKKFRVEPQEIRDEVMCIHNEQHTSRKMPPGESDNEISADVDAETCRSNIQQCMPALTQILTHLSQKTSWSFSVLIGGPDPADAEEQCVVASLHIRKNRCGLNFAESYCHFDSTVVQAYVEFLDSKLSSSISKKTGHDKGSDTNNGADVMKGDNDNKPDNHRNMDDEDEDDANIGEGQEGNDTGIGKDNEGDDVGIGDDQEGDDSGINDDQEVDNAGHSDKLSNASTLIFIFSTLWYLSVATSHDGMSVATTPPQLITGSALATSCYPIVSPLHIQTMHPSIASPAKTPAYVATPSCVAMPSSIMGLLSVAMPEHTLVPSASIQPSGISNHLLSSQDFGSFSVELDSILQANMMSMFTPQWNFNGLLLISSNPATVHAMNHLMSLTGSTTNPYLDYFTTAGQYEHLTQDLPLLPPTPSDDSSPPPASKALWDTPLGHPKCKPVPSLCAQVKKKWSELKDGVARKSKKRKTVP